jgi:NADPH2:quinone reductase
MRAAVCAELGPPEVVRARNEAELADLLVSGKVRPHIGATFPLERATEALRMVADGRAVGKVLVEVAGERT